jgi:hypothetical protein
MGLILISRGSIRAKEGKGERILARANSDGFFAFPFCINPIGEASPCQLPIPMPPKSLRPCFNPIGERANSFHTLPFLQITNIPKNAIKKFLLNIP